jgi:DMSO/TMAO reductase YedYZ molybdopterin-dependent catalytic subunit
MKNPILLRIDGEVDDPQDLTFDDLDALDPSRRVLDVKRYGAKRGGDAVTLAGLLEIVGAKPTAKYLGLHSSTDDFHASIPLAPVKERALLIYRLNDQPLDFAVGGPLRFFVPDHAACHTDEIDECANVKYVEHLELTTSKGYDNRPQDDEEHEQLHRDQ